jgi:hypothetical protein
VHSDFVMGGFGSPFSEVVFLVIVVVVLLASWVILAASRFVQGGIVERPERVPQLYGYTVCLIALVVGLTSLTSVVQNALTLGNPSYNTESPWNDWSEPSVTSFEAFRVTYDRARELRLGPNASSTPPEPVPEAELRRRYEALRADRIARTRVRAQRELVTNGLMLAVAIVLFTVHWRWVKRRVEVAGNRAAAG